MTVLLASLTMTRGMATAKPKTFTHMFTWCGLIVCDRTVQGTVRTFV